MDIFQTMGVHFLDLVGANAEALPLFLPYLGIYVPALLEFTQQMFNEGVSIKHTITRGLQPFQEK